jgi:hypothetical protein
MTDYNMFKKQYNFEYEEEFDYFVITWEDKNSEWVYKENDETEVKINMDNDYSGAYGDKTNMLWIEDIKKHYNWKTGDCIYLNTKQNCDNAFYVMRGWGEPYERTEDLKCYNIAIDVDGFVIKRFYQHYSNNETINIKKYDFVARPTCVYNDYWVDNIN